MRIIIIPHWFNRICEESGVDSGDLLDIKKLLSILSMEDVCFYMLAQEYAPGIVPESLSNDFTYFSNFSMWQNIDDDQRQELVDRLQLIQKEHENDPNFPYALMWGGPGTEPPTDIRSSVNGRMSYRINHDKGFEDVYFAEPVTSSEGLQSTVLCYADTLRAKLGFCNPAKLAKLDSFRKFEKLIRTQARNGH